MSHIGEVSWSLSLPGEASAIVVGPTGRCFVGSADQLIAIDPGGRVAWQVAAFGPVADVRLLADGALACEEGGSLVVRDQETGSQRSSQPVHRLGLVAPLPRGGMVHVESERDEAWLRRRDGRGVPVWSRRLGRMSGSAPLVLADSIVVGDGPWIKAFNLDGDELWWAGRHGFASPGTRPEARGPEPDLVSTAVMGIDESRLLAGISSWDARAYYLLDPHHRTVRAVAPAELALPLGEPLAFVAHPDRGPCLVTNGALEEDQHGVWQVPLVMIDLAGALVWTHATPVRSVAIVADRAGRCFAACSPPGERWAAHKQWVDVSKDCLLRGVGLDGQELFTWIAPAPISPRLAIGPSGEVLLASDQKLWAVR